MRRLCSSSAGAGAAGAAGARGQARRRRGQPSRLDDERRGRRRVVPVADREASVGLLDHLRRKVARDQLVARRQHHGVALDAERAVEHDEIALGIVALRVLVGLEDAEARLAPLGHRPRQMDLDVVATCRRAALPVRPRLLTSHHLELQRLAGHAVDDRLVARLAALADRIKVEPGAGGRGRDVVYDPEAGRLGRQQLVA